MFAILTSEFWWSHDTSVIVAECPEGDSGGGAMAECGDQFILKNKIKEMKKLYFR